MTDLHLVDFLKGIEKFNNIKFYEEGHAYYIGDLQVLSVTGILERFKEKFAYEEELRKKALKEGVSEEALAKEWDFKRDHALYEGVQIHRYLENILANKDVVVEKEHPTIKFDQIERSFHIMQNQAWQFYKDYVLTGKLIPLKSEFVVGSEEDEAAGQMDQLFYNTEVNAVQVWDWKTNGKFRNYSEYGNKMKHCLSHLDECELNGYSIQLKSYKYLFEKTTGLKLHLDCYIVWFNENNDSYKVIKCLDLDREVEELFAYKRANQHEFRPRPFKRTPIPTYDKAVAFGDLLNFSNLL
jgi:hypothetical protein